MKYWLHYSKSALLRFIGHLDMLHHWERILRRTGLPLAFSQGFSPHPLLSLAAPLPVGQISQAEYLELELAQAVEPAALLAAINRTLPEGLRGLAAAAVPAGTKSLMGLVRSADYQISGAAIVDLEPGVERLLAAASFPLTVKRKGGAKQVDIRPLVHSLRVSGDCRLSACLATGSTANLRPEDLLRALDVDAPAAILRLELYLQLGERAVTPWEFLGLEPGR